MSLHQRAVILIVLFCSLRVQSLHSATGVPRKCLSYTQPGDIVLGGVFPLSFKSWPVSCSSELSPWAVRLSEAMIFSIHEINNRDDVLPNITLGFDLRDDCRSEEHAMWIALSLIHNASVSFPEHHDCTPKTSGKVVGIVGSAFSETSIYLATTAALFHVPVVSYAASSDELSDKHSYPYFLRTNAPDEIQVQVIIDLLIHFKWEYIGLLYSFQSDGFHGAFALQELAEQRGVCVAFNSPIREFASAAELQATTDEIASYDKVNVIVLFGAKNEAQAVLRAVKQSLSLRSRHIVWIGTTHWGYRLAEQDIEDVVVGSLFIRDYRPKVEAFGEYFTGLQPHSDNVSPWFKEHALNWMRERNCSDLSICPLDRGNTEGLVINSVYSYAYSLDSLLRKRCQSPEGCWQQSEDVKINGVDLLAALKKVQYNGPYGKVVFDSNGDGVGKFVVSNLQLGDDGEYKMVDVGYWDAGNETRLWLNDSLIQWHLNDMDPPESVCKQHCSPGQAVITMQKRCCFGCLQCPDNSIVYNGTCSPCQVEYWPDEHFEACLRIVPSRIPLNDPLVVVILVAVIFGLLLCVATGVGLVAHRNHQLVKAISRELTGIHFAGLILSFVAVLMLLVTRPNDQLCCVVESLISISFNLAYAPTLLKVARIHRIFKMGQVSAGRPKFISPKSQVVVVLIMIVCQMIITTFSALLSPSTAAVLHSIDMGNHSEIYCRYGYGFVASCSLNLAIITGCCYFAFRARSVPDNYNESRFIAVSVYTTLILCIAAVPVYTTAVVALSKVASISMGIILHAFFSLVCQYLSKLYAVMFRQKVTPEVAAPRRQHGIPAMTTFNDTTSRQSNALSVWNIRPVGWFTNGEGAGQ